jgi:ectoine hydroxylase-related dioxygenase (phytanoyl-CoA dioxygenase family)
MIETPTITLQQIKEFDRRGVLFLQGLLSVDIVNRARDYIRERLASMGLWSNGNWVLDELRNQALDFRPARAIGNRNPNVEALIGDPKLLSVVSTLLGGQPLDRKIHQRPQILFTIPNATAWSIPVGWHVDIPRLASGRCPGVQMFTILEEVAPCGGGTLVVAGSHLLLNRGRLIKQRELSKMLRREPSFQRLYDGRSPEMEANAALDLVELTGQPGDVYLMDLRTLHAGAPNAGDRPRVMATHRFVRADAAAELADALGWH